MAYFRTLFQNFPEGTVENHENHSHDSRFPSRKPKSGPPEYEVGALTTELRRLALNATESMQILFYLSVWRCRKQSLCHNSVLEYKF